MTVQVIFGEKDGLDVDVGVHGIEDGAGATFRKRLSSKVSDIPTLRINEKYKCRVIHQIFTLPYAQTVLLIRRAGCSRWTVVYTILTSHTGNLLLRTRKALDMGIEVCQI